MLVAPPGSQLSSTTAEVTHLPPLSQDVYQLCMSVVAPAARPREEGLGWARGQPPGSFRRDGMRPNPSGFQRDPPLEFESVKLFPLKHTVWTRLKLDRTHKQSLLQSVSSHTDMIRNSKERKNNNMAANINVPLEVNASLNPEAPWKTQSLHAESQLRQSEPHA